MVDTDPYSRAKGGALDDVSLVKKYVISDEVSSYGLYRILYIC